MHCTVRQKLWSVIKLELLSHLLKLLKPFLILVNHSWLGREERGRGEREGGRRERGKGERMREGWRKGGRDRGDEE